MSKDVLEKFGIQIDQSEPPFHFMLEHNHKIDQVLKNTVQLGTSALNKCFEPIINLIADGTLNTSNIFDQAGERNLCDEYFAYLNAHGFKYYDLQGDSWESFWSCLTIAIKVELLKPVVRDSSKLVSYVMKDVSYNA